jgi:hypothetical protein
VGAGGMAEHRELLMSAGRLIADGDQSEEQRDH